MEWLFWISVALLLYTYGGYPVILIALGSLKQVMSDLRFGLARRSRRAGRDTADCPRVSIVFAAHNEATVIAQKMLNCARLDYPTERLDIVVGCDGCTDATAALARAAAPPNAAVHEFADRRGKPAVLNQLLPQTRGEIIVFCDANTEFEPDAINAIVRHFKQPDIGCVCGELRLRSRGQVSGEQLYWRFETLLKFLESRLNMLVGANGALFAIRHSLYVPVPPDGIVDDLLIAMNVRAAGYRVVYDPEAVAWEDVAPNARHEFRRHVRIGTGNFQALRHTWRLLSPRAGAVALSFWSHKVCRWLTPLGLAAAQLSAVLLAGRPLYGLAAALGGVLVLLALLGHRLDLHARYWAPASVPYTFLSMNLAILLGMFSFLRRTQSSVWTPTARVIWTPTARVMPTARVISPRRGQPPPTAAPDTRAPIEAGARVAARITTPVAEVL